MIGAGSSSSGLPIPPVLTSPCVLARLDPRIPRPPRGRAIHHLAPIGSDRITMDPGKLITIEGIDGAGKSTLSAALAEALIGRGLEAQLRREPGGVRAAERIRELVADPELEIGPR